VHGQVDLAGSIASSISFGRRLASDALQAPIEHLVAGGGDLVELDLVTAGNEEVFTCSACQSARRLASCQFGSAKFYLRGGTLSSISSR